MKKQVWCDRELIRLEMYFGLCTTEAMFHAEMRKMKVPKNTWPEFLATRHADATAHFFDNPNGGASCIVTIGKTDRDPIVVAGLLVHESVHIWQKYCERIGESNPSSEFEAYGIQSISQQLMFAYRSQIAE